MLTLADVSSASLFFKASSLATIFSWATSNSPATWTTRRAHDLDIWLQSPPWISVPWLSAAHPFSSTLLELTWNSRSVFWPAITLLLKMYKKHCHHNHWHYHHHFRHHHIITVTSSTFCCNSLSLSANSLRAWRWGINLILTMRHNLNVGQNFVKLFRKYIWDHLGGGNLISDIFVCTWSIDDCLS